MPVVRAPLAWRRGVRKGADAMATLAVGRRIKHDLRGGLGGPGVAAAAGGLRALLDVAAVGLAGLDGAPVWSGPAVPRRPTSWWSGCASATPAPPATASSPCRCTSTTGSRACW